ncbi:jg23921 [Pararge aegeria aegeria]|uniref:Jg23921 protein n=1 Tax=Pararge aegeria aegeria TaxID=348720 RepID=A0A8S4QRX7_9NEOP|nr:jg23921 [Pararge aegeria aegeria]
MEKGFSPARAFDTLGKRERGNWDAERRTSELVALVAVSCTLFLFLHTRDLSTKLRQMQRLNDDVTAFNHLTDSK